MSKINCLVSTSAGLFMIENSNPQKVLDGFFYGITWDEKNIYIAQRFSELKVDLLILDKSFNIEKRHVLPKVGATHQILYNKEQNLLVITNTRYNKLCIFYLNNNEIKDICWNEWNKKNGQLFPNNVGTPDFNHINSVWHDGQFFWVCEHNGGGKIAHPSYIKKLDKDFEIIEQKQIGKKIHNVYVEDDFLYVCNSSNHSLIKYDLKQNKITMEKNFGIGISKFIRGLSRTKDGFLIGLSNLGNRNARHKSEYGYILKLDDNFNVLEEVKIKIKHKSIGQLFDIRNISDIDKSHNNISFR
jgi:hypothetical protein